MTSRLPNIQVRRQRWLEFADFMESLPEHKFNHGTWCMPDHTCKTTACVAGWAAIQYSDKVKEWLNTKFAFQIASKRLNKLRSPASITKCEDEIRDLDNKAIELENFQWDAEGQKVLYLSYGTSYKLFYPHSSFWTDHKLDLIQATNKDIALIFRYLATRPVRDVNLPTRFLKDELQSVVDAHFKKEA